MATPEPTPTSSATTPIRSVSRVYADVNKNLPPSHWDFENFAPEYNEIDNYEIIRKLGRGKYSEVFQGVDVNDNKKVVIKVLKPVNKKKIKREILIMKSLRGGPNILNLHDTVRDEQSKTVCLISEYINNQDHVKLYPTLSDEDIRYYCYQILKGLDYAHSRGIMHRDLKPHNIMIDHSHRKLRIIDWGLAEFYHPNVKYNVRVASRYYKGPELLVNMRDYDYSLDMWSFGCVLAGMIFQIPTFFRGKDNPDQLAKIAKVCGTQSIYNYAEKYGAEIDAAVKRVLSPYNGRSLSYYVSSKNQHLANPEAIDLLSKVLVIDHNNRLTAKEAMEHGYFDSVRHLQLEKDYSYTPMTHTDLVDVENPKLE